MKIVSEKTNKEYASVEECLAAEKAYDEQIAAKKAAEEKALVAKKEAKEKALAERKAAAAVVEEKRKIVRFKRFGSVVFDDFRLLENLVNVHEVELMAHGMEEMLLLFGHFSRWEKFVELGEIDVVQYPFRAQPFLFDAKNHDDVGLFAFVLESGRHF